MITEPPPRYSDIASSIYLFISASAATISPLFTLSRFRFASARSLPRRSAFATPPFAILRFRHFHDRRKSQEIA